jgi:hypothetical protein
VVIATLASELRSDVTMDLPVPPAEPARSSVAESTIPVAPLLPSPPGTSSAPLPARAREAGPRTVPRDPTSLSATLPSAAQRQARIELGAAFLASFAGGAFAPGGQIDLAVTPRRSDWAARLSFLAAATRDLELGDGRASWTRFGLGIGPRYRVRRGQRWRFDLHADGYAALVMMKGAGFRQNELALNFDPGLGLGGRAALRLGRGAPFFGAAPFIGVDLVGWLRRQEVMTLASVSADLPQLEVLLTAGVAIGRSP